MNADHLKTGDEIGKAGSFEFGCIFDVAFTCTLKPVQLKGYSHLIPKEEHFVFNKNSTVTLCCVEAYITANSYVMNAFHVQAKKTMRLYTIPSFKSSKNPLFNDKHRFSINEVMENGSLTVRYYGKERGGLMARILVMPGDMEIGFRCVMDAFKKFLLNGQNNNTPVAKRFLKAQTQILRPKLTEAGYSSGALVNLPV
jgi:hypothetical protein